MKVAMNRKEENLVGLLLLQTVLCMTTPQTLLSAEGNLTGKLLEEAEHEAGGIDNDYLCENTFKDIAVAQARSNHPEKALEIISELSQRDDKNLTLIEIAEAQAKSHHVEAAFDTVTRIGDETDRAVAMEAVALAQLSEGDPAGALHTAHRIPGEINRSSVLMHIGLMACESGNVPHAIEMAHQIPGSVACRW